MNALINVEDRIVFAGGAIGVVIQKCGVDGLKLSVSLHFDPLSLQNHSTLTLGSL